MHRIPYGLLKFYFIELVGSFETSRETHSPRVKLLYLQGFFASVPQRNYSSESHDPGVHFEGAPHLLDPLKSEQLWEDILGWGYYEEPGLEKGLGAKQSQGQKVKLKNFGHSSIFSLKTRCSLQCAGKNIQGVCQFCTALWLLVENSEPF